MSGAAEPPVAASSGSSPAVPSPPPQQQQQQEITADQLSDAPLEVISNGARSKSDELRGWLMLVATLTASITYSAALNPPGGVWQTDDPDKGYIAGKPVLFDKFRLQYLVFFYLNATSFITSLIIIVALSTPSFYDKIPRSSITTYVAVDILAWAGAFIAGSSTSPGALVYELAFLLLALVYIVVTRVCS